jgi:hypothetical protein
MTETQLVALFRHTLRVSLAIPLLAGAFACGGRTDDLVSPLASDAATNDDATTSDGGITHPGTCQSQACTLFCQEGCELTSTCLEDHLECSCDCAPPPLDASTGDADTCTGGCDCPSDCQAMTSCVNGQLSCICACEVPPADGGDADGSFSDAGASDPCHPVVENCNVPPPIPLSCFDALPTPAEGGLFSIDECDALCPTDNGFEYECSIQPPSASSPGGLACEPLCPGGRAFEGMLTPAANAGESPLARYFTQSAHLEAAAVDAFLILHDELVAHGAPDALAIAAERAADDEVRHTRMTRQIARRFGGSPTESHAEKRAVRPLLAIAIENAVEGCVRETFAALLAHHQAVAANDPRIRATMASIAPDETRHAALSWEVAAWAELRLDDQERAEVREAQREAVRALRETVAHEVHESIKDVAGVPDAATATRMVAELEATLWS